MSVKARFTGGGPFDGDERTLDRHPPPSEVYTIVRTRPNGFVKPRGFAEPRSDEPIRHHVYRLHRVDNETDPHYALYRYEGQQ